MNKVNVQEHYVLRKFEGDATPNKLPVEIKVIDIVAGIPVIQTITDQEEIINFLLNETNGSN